MRSVAAGEGVSYGLRHRFRSPARLAVVPLGYADGVPRRLGELGADVLIGGVRRPMRGGDHGPAGRRGDRRPEVAVGDEVVLIGRQGDEEITTGEWAEMLGTISYEIVCGFGPRLPRRHLTRISHGAGFVDGWADRPAGPGPDPSGGGGS